MLFGGIESYGWHEMGLGQCFDHAETNLLILDWKIKKEN